MGETARLRRRLDTPLPLVAWPDEADLAWVEGLA